VISFIRSFKEQYVLVLVPDGPIRRLDYKVTDTLYFLKANSIPVPV